MLAFSLLWGNIRPMITRKPSYDEWMYWTQVIVDRLTAIVHVYGHPPYEDVFMPEKTRQEKMGQALNAMRYLHELTDTYDLTLPSDPEDAREREEALLTALSSAFQEILTLTPTWSEDMQYLLKSPWASNCVGKIAQTLFCGANNQLAQGIGSGLPENGRLPHVLENLIDREITGDERAPRAEKSPLAPQRMRREDLARHWGRQNSGALSRAGRVD